MNHPRLFYEQNNTKLNKVIIITSFTRSTCHIVCCAVECVEGQIQLADSQRVKTDEGIEYISGYPVICVDTEYVPVCNISSIGLREVAVLCSASENITS